MGPPSGKRFASLWLDDLVSAEDIRCSPEKEKVGQDDRRDGLEDDRHPERNAGVMPAREAEGDDPILGQVDCPLGERDAGCRPDSDSKHKVVSVGDSSVDSPGMICFCPAGPVDDRVVELASFASGGPKPIPKFDGFDSRDGKDSMSQQRFDRVEKRFAQPGRDIFRPAFHNSAERIPDFLRSLEKISEILATADFDDGGSDVHSGDDFLGDNARGDKTDSQST